MPFVSKFGGRERARVEFDGETGQITGVMLDAREWPEGLKLSLTAPGGQTREFSVAAGESARRSISAGQRVQMTRDLANPKVSDRNWKPPEAMRVRLEGVA